MSTNQESESGRAWSKLDLLPVPAKALVTAIIMTIFTIMGAITLFLDLGIRTRSWLVVLPFVGVFIDIAAMWLKVYISPVFFWLHIPGGSLFGFVFVFVSIKAFWEMWWPILIQKNVSI